MKTSEKVKAGHYCNSYDTRTDYSVDTRIVASIYDHLHITILSTPSPYHNQDCPPNLLPPTQEKKLFRENIGKFNGTGFLCLLNFRWVADPISFLRILNKVTRFYFWSVQDVYQDYIPFVSLWLIDSQLFLEILTRLICVVAFILLP